MEGETDFCSDCFAECGQYHAIGCDLEECPKCHKQMISCKCVIDEYKKPNNQITGANHGQR